MKESIVGVWLTIFICAAGIFAQEKKEGNYLFVPTPREIVLPVIAVQPDCPLKFENVANLTGVGGGGQTKYQIRNVGTKPIRRFEVMSSAGMGGTWFRNDGALLMPGQVAPFQAHRCKNCPQDEVIPLTDELREKLKLTGEMRTIVILMVISVEFADGTRFDDEKTFNAMISFIQNLAEAKYQYEKNKKVVQK